MFTYIHTYPIHIYIYMVTLELWKMPFLLQLPAARPMQR